MEELYDFFQHTHYMCIYLNETAISTRVYSTLASIYFNITFLKIEANIIYNKQKTEVLDWGTTEYELNEDCILYDNFRNRLYHLFKKDKHNWDEDDIFFIEAVAQFLMLVVEYKIEKEREVEHIESFDSLSYVFAVPSEWETDIREDLIRPIFIKAGLLSRNDHQDRLLFLSDLESICYSAQADKNNDIFFMRGQNTIICRCKVIDEETAIIKIDLINTSNILYDLPAGNLYPKTKQSDFFFITSKTIKKGIKTYLNVNLFLLKEGVGQSKNIDMLVDDIYGKIDQMIEGNDCYDLIDSKEWNLNDSQRTLLNSIDPFKICSLINKTIRDKINNICSIAKRYEFFLLGEDVYFEEGSLEYLLTQWIAFMLISLNGTPSVHREDLITSGFDNEEVVGGGACFAMSNSQNYALHSIPRIYHNKNQSVSSSIFRNSRPEAIINIDISLKSTSLSYLILNEDGVIVDIFDNNYFAANKRLPSLEKFYNINSNKEVALKTTEQFISFAEKYLLTDYSELLLMDKDFVAQIEIILDENQLKKESREVSIYQEKYIKAFMFMYFVYIKSIISSKLPVPKKLDETSALKTGYSVTVQNYSFYNIADSNDNKDIIFRDFVYKALGLDINDDSKKLRVIIKGENVLPLIQPLLKLELPVRSHFVSTQLYESHILLALNHVVTVSTVEEKQQEATFIDSKEIPIQNIYDTLCLNMWNNFVQDSSLILLCDIHCEDKVLELFSVLNKIEFATNFKEYISKNILASNSNLRKLNENSIKMSPTCNCKAILTLNDVVQISFKPLLKKITSICMGSLINKKIFRDYGNIDYHFTLIHFNENRQFLNIITDILREECEEFNPWQGIDTICIVIPELPTQFFQPTLNIQPSVYKEFSTGVLKLVHSENIALKITTDSGNDIMVYIYNKIEDDYVGVKNDRLFPLFKKGDLILDEWTKKMYLEFSRGNKAIKFTLYTYKTYGALNCDGTIGEIDLTWHELGSLNYEPAGSRDENILSVTFKCPTNKYSTYLLPEMRIVEKSIQYYKLRPIAYTMTLGRF